MSSVEYKVNTVDGGIGDSAWRASVRHISDGISIEVHAHGASAAYATDALKLRLGDAAKAIDSAMTQTR